MVVYILHYTFTFVLRPTGTRLV